MLSDCRLLILAHVVQNRKVLDRNKILVTFYYILLLKLVSEALKVIYSLSVKPLFILRRCKPGALRTKKLQFYTSFTFYK